MVPFKQMNSQDKLAHCRLSSRRQVLCFHLCLLGLEHGLCEDLLKIILKFITCGLPAEREGYNAFIDKRDREKAARDDAEAEDFVPKWKLLGFPSLFVFIDHVRNERRREENRKREMLPDYVLFGFGSDSQLRKAKKLMR